MDCASLVRQARPTFRAHGKEVNLAWFVGFAPVENPQIAVAVMVEGTSSLDSYHGGSTAGPVAKDIFLEFIEQYPERAGFQWRGKAQELIRYVE
jgi:penicillin-binding protein 2